MEPFLKQVARFLYAQHGGELSQYSLIFPGRRAGVFFTAYLNELIEKPMLSPEIRTITELISSFSSLQQADPVSLILKLQHVFNRVTGFNEPIDEFFFWGEILLGDFDDIDKYLLDADDLFRNMADLKELETQFEYLTPEQRHAIEEFWGNLSKVPHSFNKEKFIELWTKLPLIYHEFRNELASSQTGYSGMIYRDMAEHLEEHIAECDHPLVFIGFNALNACENKLFRSLQKAGKAQFFWDYADSYLKDPENEAGLFLRENLVKYPAPQGFSPESGFRGQKRKITLVAVPGNITQAQAINLPQVTGAFSVNNHFDNTAFVLSDENLLVPIVSAAGNRFSGINITMGYPFVNTPVYGFISQLFALQRNIHKLPDDNPVFYYKPVVALLNHQFIVSPEIKEFVSLVHKQNKVYLEPKELFLNDFLKRVFSVPEKWDDLLAWILEIIRELSLQFDGKTGDHQLENDYLFQAYLCIQRLLDTLTNLGVTDFPVKILIRLLDQSLRRISIPFEGEPLTGLQVMGVLETRCLDFQNLVIFSANEGHLPSISSGHSFIPYHLRKGFGLPTYEERDAMYAYYFYRLIQRSEQTVLVYNSITEGVATAERSRYLYQLLYDSDFIIEKLNLNFDFRGKHPMPIRIAAAPSHRQKLLSLFSGEKLSPSAINMYLDCKLKFYFRYLAGLKEKEELKEEVDPVLFGNLFHYAIELIYRPFIGKEVVAGQLKAILLDKAKLDQVVRQSFAEKYYRLKPGQMHKFRLSGQNILVAGYIRNYLEQLLCNDIRIAPFTVIGLESEYTHDFCIDVDGQPQTIRVGGIIDRIDRTAQGTRIVDYKTGRNLKLDFKDWPELTDRNQKDRRKEIFQTLIYSAILNHRENHRNIYPVIYKLDNLFDDEFNPHIVYNGTNLRYQDVSAEFEEKFGELLSELFSASNCYEQTSDEHKCSYCPYAKICQKG